MVKECWANNLLLCRIDSEKGPKQECNNNLFLFLFQWYTSLSKLSNVQNNVRNNQEYLRPTSLILSEAEKAEKKAKINQGQEQLGIIMEVIEAETETNEAVIRSEANEVDFMNIPDWGPEIDRRPLKDSAETEGFRCYTVILFLLALIFIGFRIGLGILHLTALLYG